jgi:hypothetical protein
MCLNHRALLKLHLCYVVHYHKLLSCGGQGRNADALALYFSEDPARCPFEQGKLYLEHFSYLP